MIEMIFAELHTPLFLAGTNLGNKLDPSRKAVKLMYDRENKELLVVFNGGLAVVPTTGNIASMTPKDPKEFDIDLTETKPATRAPSPITKAIKAQVEAPHEKVQNPPTRRSVPNQ